MTKKYVKDSFDDLLDDGSEEAVLLLETALAFCQKSVEIKK